MLSAVGSTETLPCLPQLGQVNGALILAFILNIYLQFEQLNFPIILCYISMFINFMVFHAPCGILILFSKNHLLIPS